MPRFILKEKLVRLAGRFGDGERQKWQGWCQYSSPEQTGGVEAPFTETARLRKKSRAQFVSLMRFTVI